MTTTSPVRLPRLAPTPRQLRVLALLVAFAVVPPLLTRVGMLTDLWAFALAGGATAAATALSLNILMGYAGQISLGHAGFLAVGAYVSGVLTSRFGLAMLVGLLAAAAFTAVAAFLVGLPALRLKGLYLAITTIGFLVVMQRSVLKLPWLSRGSAGVELPRPEAWTFAFTRNADYLALALVFVVLFWVLDANITRTRLGRAFQGLREDEQVAQSYGVDVARHKLLAFVVSGALAGVAGALFGHLIQFVNSDVFDLQRSLLLVAVVVIGGLGSRLGAVIVAGAFGFLPVLFLQVFKWDVIQGWEFIVSAALLIVTLALNPNGLVQGLREHREERRAARVRAGLAESEDAAAMPALPDLPRPPEVTSGRHPATDETLLEVRDLTVRFGGLTAVDRVSLNVPAHRIVGLIGPNGAGKTTLFNAISGFETVESGRVHLLGDDVTGLAPHERAAAGIGRTFQHGGLALNLSVLDNLLLAQHQLATYDVASALGNLPPAARREVELHERSRSVVAALGFEDKADEPVRNLSGGQRRIVEMACALMTSPELLLLDEPSAGMAPAVVENLAERLRELRDDLDRTVLLVEHHIPLVLDVCDLVYVLDYGRVIAAGEPDDVVEDPRVLEAYLGGDPALIGAGGTTPTGTETVEARA